MTRFARWLVCACALTSAPALAAPVTTTFFSPQYAPSGGIAGFSFQLTYDLGVSQFGSAVQAFGGPSTNPVFATAGPAVFDTFATTRCNPNRVGPNDPPSCTIMPVTRFVLGGAAGGAQTLGADDFLLTFDLDQASNILNVDFGFNQPTLRVTTTSNGVATTSNELLIKGASVAAAVPEPVTWAMMLTGIGIAGVGLRARRRRGWQAAATA